MVCKVDSWELRGCFERRERRGEVGRRGGRSLGTEGEKALVGRVTLIHASPRHHPTRPRINYTL